VKDFNKGDPITREQINLIVKYIPELNSSRYFRNYIVQEDLKNLPFDWTEMDKRINWYIISEFKNPTEKQKQKTYLDKRNSLLYFEKIDNIKYIELGPNIEVLLSYELIEKTYDLEEKEFKQKL